MTLQQLRRDDLDRRVRVEVVGLPYLAGAELICHLCRLPLEETAEVEVRWDEANATISQQAHEGPESTPQDIRTA